MLYKETLILLQQRRNRLRNTVSMAFILLNNLIYTFQRLQAERERERERERGGEEKREFTVDLIRRRYADSSVDSYVIYSSVCLLVCTSDDDDDDDDDDWCFRPRFCNVRLYWVGDNLGACSSVVYISVLFSCHCECMCFPVFIENKEL